MNEAINDSAKLIARSLELLKELNKNDVALLSEAIKLLEEALDKTAKAM